MANIRRGLVNDAMGDAYAVIDYQIHNNIEKQQEFLQKNVFANESLNKDEKAVTIDLLKEIRDRDKIRNNDGTKRTCEDCQQKCLATLYCEICFKNYLEKLFPKWTSGNKDIDNLIQTCQKESIAPNRIVEWIPYNKLRNCEYFAEGGCSIIYSAIWIDGPFNKWDDECHQLKRQRQGTCSVILKELENNENANRSWYEEVKSHLLISNKWQYVAKCYGLTQDPNNKYMLVMHLLDIDLRNYLKENHSLINWKVRIHITYYIISALCNIHKEKVIHRDLHSGNILYSTYNDVWYISDFGFSGPANKPLGSIYGCLPYIAPEIIYNKGNEGYTYKSDVYSIGILMWEISSGQLPYADFDHDELLAIDIANGMRPEILPETPIEYKKLIEQCWDARPRDGKKHVLKRFLCFLNVLKHVLKHQA